MSTKPLDTDPPPLVMVTVAAPRRRPRRDLIIDLCRGDVEEWCEAFGASTVLDLNRRAGNLGRQRERGGCHRVAVARPVPKLVAMASLASPVEL